MTTSATPITVEIQRKIRIGRYCASILQSQFKNGTVVYRPQKKMVPKAGLEPARLPSLPPQDSVSTNSTTWAITIATSGPITVRGSFTRTLIRGFRVGVFYRRQITGIFLCRRLRNHGINRGHV